MISQPCSVLFCFRTGFDFVNMVPNSTSNVVSLATRQIPHALQVPFHFMIKMQDFCAGLDTLKKSSIEYEAALKKTSEANSILRGAVEKMATALDNMKRIFNHTKCGICCSRDQNTALECGHCLCNVCSIRALRAERCPFCRKAVTESLKIYL